MNVIISLDYELFFGARHGTPEKCLVEPCDALLKVTDQFDGQLVFFIDAGYLVKLNQYRSVDREVEREASVVFRHLEALSQAGHELQLHVHPHWEDTRRIGRGWHFDLRRYALHDFESSEIKAVIRKYKDALIQFTDSSRVICYRAGGWVIQPFADIAPALRENGIWVDSTVFPGGCARDSTQVFDFKGAPNKDHWWFDDDPVVEVDGGSFLEIPISSIPVPPWNYWSLAFGKLAGNKSSRAWGNGASIPLGKGDLASKLLRPTVSVASIDGEKAKWLARGYQRRLAQGGHCFTVLGHPKALTRDSLAQLEKFLLARPEIELMGYHRYLAGEGLIQQSGESVSE